MLMAGMDIYFGKKTLRFFFLGTNEPILMKLCTTHRGIKSMTVYLNGDPVTLYLFYGRVKFCNINLNLENCENYGFLEIIAAYYLEVY